MKKIITILASALLVLITGCKSTIPMPSYNDQPIATYGNNKSTLESVEKSIVRAAISLGWKTQKQSDGSIEATLDIRKHQLVVLITYDEKNISVNYVDSKNLKYDGKKIHRQYANWVTNLLRAINANNIAG